MKKILLNILSILARCKYIYLISKKIVDFARNENNCDIKTNGEMNFIISHKDSFETIFDVGANVGEWTELVSSIMPTAHIYSFEPSIDTFKILSSKHFNKNITTENIGLGESNQEIEFYSYGEASTLNSRHKREEIGTIATQKAIFRTLDDYAKENNIERISFLKIDTEGNELSVLQGASVYIQEGRIDLIQFEYGGTYIDAHILLKDVFAYFADKPYTIYKMHKNNITPALKYSEDLENFQYSNYIAKLDK